MRLLQDAFSQRCDLRALLLRNLPHEVRLPVPVNFGEIQNS